MATSAALGVAALGAAPAAALDATTGDPVIVGLAQPDVLRTETAPAGSLRIASTDAANGGLLTVEEGEQIVIEVDDALGRNCTGLTSAEHIGFASMPTVTVQAGPGVEVSAALRASSPANAVTHPAGSGTCTGFLPPTNDQLVLTVGQAPVGGGTVGSITISGVSYAVGSLAAVGFVDVVTAVDNDPAAGYEQTLPETSNAYVTNLDVGVGPAQAIEPGAGRPAPTITLRETTPDATTPTGATGAVCINLTGADIVDIVAPAPTVTATASPGPADTVSGVDILDGGDTLRIRITDAVAAAETTFTVSGMRVNTNAGQFGRQTFEVDQCNPDPAVTTFQPLPIVPANDPAAGDTSTVTDYTNPEGDGSLSNLARSVRFAGNDRFETAAAIAASTFGPTCSEKGSTVYAVLARGDDFPDALAGSYVAGVLDAPILLTLPNEVPAATLTALRNLGVTDVVVMGGTSAVSQAVADQLDAALAYACGGGSVRQTAGAVDRTLTIQRVGGADRYATAAQAAGFGDAGAVGTIVAGGPERRTALLANGLSFPDALAGGPMAFQGCKMSLGTSGCGSSAGFPLLLASGQSTTLPAPTSAALTAEGIDHVVILGGTAAVPQAIETALEAAGYDVTRLAGGTRQETAVAIAAFETDVLDWDHSGYPSVSLARGDGFADALAMGPHAGAHAHELLLTASPTSLGGATAARLGDLGVRYGTGEVHLAGGVAAISAAVEQAAVDALRGL